MSRLEIGLLSLEGVPIMQQIASLEWWKNNYQEARNLLKSPQYVSAIRAIGVFSATVYVIPNTPKWIKIAMNLHHFLGINVVLFVGVFLYRIWTKYINDVKVSLFRLFKYGLHYVRLFIENYTNLDPSTENYQELYRRRKENRKFIRTGIIFVLMQYCIVAKSHLLWIQSFVAYKFLADLVNFVQEKRQHYSNAPSDTEQTGDSTQETTDATLSKEELLVLIGKSILVFIFFNRLWNISVVYLILTSLAFCLVNRSLEQPLTNFLEFFQCDFFEGLEQFYVTGLLGFLEVSISFVFMTWTLVLHNQYLMLIALYTNIYVTSKEVIHGAITAALAEWFLLVQFDRATEEELNTLDDVCSICLSTMKRARKTKCNHFFHGHCLRRCFKEKNACPYCNQTLIT